MQSSVIFFKLPMSSPGSCSKGEILKCDILNDRCARALVARGYIARLSCVRSVSRLAGVQNSRKCAKHALAKVNTGTRRTINRSALLARASSADVLRSRGSKAKCSDIGQEARNYAKLSDITEEHARRPANGPTTGPRTIYTVAPGRCA